MGKTATISFKDDDEEIYQWMEDQHETGMFRNRSHVVVEALKKMMMEDEDEKTIT